MKWLRHLCESRDGPVDGVICSLVIYHVIVSSWRGTTFILAFCNCMPVVEEQLLINMMTLDVETQHCSVWVRIFCGRLSESAWMILWYGEQFRMCVTVQAKIEERSGCVGEQPITLWFHAEFRRDYFEDLKSTLFWWTKFGLTFNHFLSLHKYCIKHFIDDRYPLRRNQYKYPSCTIVHHLFIFRPHNFHFNAD